MDCKISSPHSVPHTIDRYVQFVWPVPEGQNDDSLVREAIPSNGTQSRSILCGKACSPATRSLSATARGLLKCDITTRDFVIAAAVWPVQKVPWANGRSGETGAKGRQN
jgi:hypothetical protein